MSIEELRKLLDDFPPPDFRPNVQVLSEVWQTLPGLLKLIDAHEEREATTRELALSALHALRKRDGA